MDPAARRATVTRLKETFEAVTDRGADGSYADLTNWWRDPSLLADSGSALAHLFPESDPTVVIAPASRGLILGALAATTLGVGLVEARRDRGPATDTDTWVQRTTPPDYHDRHVTFGFRRSLVRSGDRVLLVDDWAATGATATTVQQLVADTGASWIGAAVLVDALEDSRLRRTLNMRCLVRERELW